MRLRPELSGTPLILYKDHRRPTVLEACSLAAAKGARGGMALSRAVSLCPRATVLPENQRLYQAAGEALLETLLRFTWKVEAAGPGLAFMAVRGLGRIGGDEQDIARSVLQRAQEIGFPGRVAVATGRFVAEVAAKHRRGFVVLPDGEEVEVLDSMPADVLPSATPEWREMKRRLNLLGVRTLGAVRRLGKTAMQAQFGRVGLQAWRMSAGKSEPLTPAPLPPGISAGGAFQPPLGRWQDIEMAAGELAADLSIQLGEGGRACAALEVAWRAENFPGQAREVVLKRPSWSRDAILTAALPGLEDELPGPLEQLQLKAKTVMPEVAEQLSLFAGRNAAVKLDDVAADLQRRFGKAVLLQTKYLGPNLLEEDAFALQPLGAGSTPSVNR
jgi:DNA polymerase-4